MERCCRRANDRKRRRIQMRITWAVLKGLPNLSHLIIVVLGPSVLPRGKTKVSLREQKMRDSEPLVIECGPYYKSAPRHKWEGDGVVSETATINFGVNARRGHGWVQV